MRHYFLALFSPSGRISRGALIALGLPLLVLAAYARFHLEMRLQEGHPVQDWWYALILVLLWSQFCLVARVLQNSEVPGIVALPLFALVAFDFLLVLDPSVLGTSGEDFDANYEILDQAIRSSVYLVRGAVIWGIINGESDGDNAYGPPFGTESTGERSAKHQRIRERVRSQYRATGSADPLARLSSLERGGQTTSSYDDHSGGSGGSKLGFNRPSRRSGFGQR